MMVLSLVLYYIELFVKNGLYIHFITALLYYNTNNSYIAWNLSIKLYSLNYFYWYGHLYSYLPNPKYNWIKQFIRFTDTGHIASALPFFYPNGLTLYQFNNSYIQSALQGHFMYGLIKLIKSSNFIEKLRYAEFVQVKS